jgi:hypothetical protein
MKILSAKQAQAAARALRRQGKSLPAMGRCTVLRKVGKAKGFGVLPRGVSAEVCREAIAGRDVVTVRIAGPKRKSKALAGRAARRRRRKA